VKTAVPPRARIRAVNMAEITRALRLVGFLMFCLPMLPHESGRFVTDVS
jgi:hypothetical protein